MNEIDKKLYLLFSDKTLSEGCEVFATLCEPNWLPKDDYNMDYFYIWRDNKFEEIHWTVYITHNQMEYALYTVLWHEPQLHDVFRLAKERNIIVLFRYNYFKKDYVWLEFDNSFWEDDIFAMVEYNPTLSLMNQEDSTKQAIVDLFSN